MPTEFIIKRNVPILDEHEIVEHDDDGDEDFKVKVDAKKLNEIARRNNKRISDTGDLVPLVIGHTKDHAPEHRQPEIVGYACNFSVGNLFKTGRKALKATFKFFKDKVNKVRNFPRRSVELWLSDWKIDPIALLGASTPERDLGLLQLSKGGRRSYKRVFNPLRYQQASLMDSKQIVDAVLAALKNDAVYKWAEQQMQASDSGQCMDGSCMPGEMPGQMPGEMPGGPGGDEPMMPEEDYDDGEAGDNLDDEDYDDEDEGEPQRYAAGYPSGSSTFAPGGSFGRRPARPSQYSRRPIPAAYCPTTPDRYRIRRDQNAGQVARYQRQLAQVMQAHEALRLRYQRTERERDLIQLESEGFVFDRVEELDAIAGLTDHEYRRYLSRVRKNYQRAPVSALHFSREARTQPAASTNPQRSKDDMRRIAQYATDHKISYAEAVEKVEGGEPVF